MAALLSALPTFLLARDRIGITTRETQAKAIPGILCSGVVFLARSDTDSYVMYAARARKQTPTILRLTLSFLSRLSTSESTDILHSNVAPDVTSMKLSIPKPTREMLPETAPAAIATKPSRKFHTIVKYSSRFPRWAIAWRAIVNSFILGAYQGIIGGIRNVRSTTGSLCGRMSFFLLQCPPT